MWCSRMGKKKYFEVDHFERKKEKKYMSGIEDPKRRGRPVVRWKDRVNEYTHERIGDRGRGLQQARKECADEER